ncbi:aspartyl-phosphate phosphatase Spo0E family protein [Paenibacillus sp. Soil787]|uniref:Spo0E family sporulation regulatory protein-aspartic acid phosphatase n=1 Tax=Paenibacillus sp. Soil787 TaxID=1736411 RepID=UPI0012E34447
MERLTQQAISQPLSRLTPEQEKFNIFNKTVRNLRGIQVGNRNDLRSELLLGLSQELDDLLNKLNKIKRAAF